MEYFPSKQTGLIQGESPSLYKNVIQTNESSASTDGGYQFRRRRFTRAPSRAIETGFKSLPHEDFLILEKFFEDHQKDVSFMWFDQIREEFFEVRFDEFTPSYEGIGTTRLHNITIKMSTI